jgi:hypothetical protein
MTRPTAFPPEETPRGGIITARHRPPIAPEARAFKPRPGAAAPASPPHAATATTDVIAEAICVAVSPRCAHCTLGQVCLREVEVCRRCFVAALARRAGHPPTSVSMTWRRCPICNQMCLLGEFEACYKIFTQYRPAQQINVLELNKVRKVNLSSRHTVPSHPQPQTPNLFCPLLASSLPLRSLLIPCTLPHTHSQNMAAMVRSPPTSNATDAIDA